ncbi:haloacid dehalogenase [bacterium]|nr:haloacid dehalogenase [bacterium]
MPTYSDIADLCRQDLDTRHQAREQALQLSRQLTRFCANSIRAIHRGENDEAASLLAEARAITAQLGSNLQEYQDLFFSGYTQDAIKEFVEASCTCAIILDQPLPTHKELEVTAATYLRGLAETPGELRRRCLDILRKGYSEEAERLLAHMDEIYAMLVAMDYPDAITNGLRHQTDQLRGIIERTRADLTISLGEHRLQQELKDFEKRLNHNAAG